MNYNPRIYIETTIFNRYFEEEREYSVESKRLFEKIAAGEVTAFTSTAVIKELEQAPEPKRSQMLKLVTTYNIRVWEVEQEAEDLADLYIAAGIIPTRFWLDGVHIAMAATNDVDCIISLNFKHINRLKTKTATEAINRLRGYASPFICTPMEVIYDDN